MGPHVKAVLLRMFMERIQEMDRRGTLMWDSRGERTDEGDEYFELVGAVEELEREC